MRRALLLLPAALLGACSSGPPTIDSLSDAPVAVAPKPEVKITRQQAIAHYRRFLELAPDSPMYPQALRRLAELEVLNAEEAGATGQAAAQEKARRQAAEAIRLYDTYLRTYPDRPDNDQILYQQAKAYELRGDTEKSLAALQRLVQRYPRSRYLGEAYFRRGELLFSLQRYAEAEKAFYAIGALPNSPYQEKALYKYAWSLFKQSRYDEALNAFFNLLDRQQEYGLINNMEFPPHISPTERALVEDTLRAISLALTYREGTQTLAHYLSRHQAQQYEPLLYNSLAKLHLQKRRYTDAADAFLAFTRRHPDSHLSPRFHQKAIDAYRQAGLTRLVLSAKADFISRYDQNSRFWMQQSAEVRRQVTDQVKQHVRDLAAYYHAAARKHKRKPKQQQSDYRQAVYWYDYYLKSWPRASDAAGINFQLAEALNESRHYSRAIAEFERTAYDYPAHEKSAEAAYAALLIYPRLLKQAGGKQANTWQEKEIDAALRFSDRFAEDKRAVRVLTRAAEKLYARGEYRRALDTARLLTRRITVAAPPALHRTAWIVFGHSAFELAEFGEAETAYTHALEYIPAKSRKAAERKQRRAIQERLAASIYKQGEAARQQGQIDLAITHFSRIRQLVPASAIRQTADYDAASLLIQSGRISDAQPLLEDLRRRYPRNTELQTGITTKLAFIYAQTGQSLKAARELEKLALADATAAAERRDLHWQAAELYRKAGRGKDAARLYKSYVRRYPRPFATALEARQHLVEYYQAEKNHKAAWHWMNEIIKADRDAGAQRNDRSRYLAASATLQLASPIKHAYQRVRLTVPLKKSLKKKKKLMQRAVKAYRQALGYRLAEISTQATYEIAEIYNDFSRALMKSQRPRNLSGEALEQYDILLEEQAFPFEEKAIAIHQSNLKNMQQGIFDQWVRKSLQQLQQLQPIRYAKHERIDSHVSSLY